MSHIIDVPPTADDVIEPPGVAHIMRGLYFLQQGHAAAAIPHLRLALIYDQTSPYLHEKLAEAWIDEGSIDKADEVLQHGLAAAPADAHLSTIAGELARRRADYGAAAAHFDHGLSDTETVSLAGPGAVDALLWMHDGLRAERVDGELATRYSDDDNLAVLVGTAFEDHGRLDRALASYRRARAVKPGSRDAALGEMRVLELLGKTSEAANTLVELFAYEPGEIALYTQVMRLYLRIGASSAEAYKSEALRIAGDETLQRVIVASGEIAEGYLTSGVATIRDAAQGESDEARRLAIREFIADNYLRAGEPEHCLDELTTPIGIPEILRTRGLCRGALGHVEDALHALAEARKEGGNPRVLAFDAARIAATSEDEVRGRRLLDAFLQATLVGQYDATLARAIFAQQVGHEVEASALLSALYGSTRPDTDLRLRWADALARTDRLDEALGVLRALLEEQPDDPTRLNALGFTLVEANRDLEDAEVYLRHAYRLASDETFIIDSLGWLLHVRGNDVLAESLLRRAVNGSPADPEILMHLGEVCRARGKSDEAHTLFVKAARSLPSRALKVKLERLVKERV